MKHCFAMLLAALMFLGCLPSLAEKSGYVDPVGSFSADRLLAGEAVNAPVDANVTENDCEMYRVIVLDRDGNPVEGAVIQFCDDATCSFQVTDAEGVAAFPVGQGKVFEVHVLRAPEGYAGTDEVFYTLEIFSDVTISLEKTEQAASDE